MQKFATKLLFPLLIFHVLLCLAGCTGSGVAQEPPQTPQNSPQTLPENSAAYLSWYSDILPVSLVQGGSQQLINVDPQWYFEVQELCQLESGNPDPPADTACHQVADAYVDGQTPFDQPPIEGWLINKLYWRDSQILRQLYIQGDWQPFCTPIRYEVYTPDNQPNLPQAWVDHFQELLGEAAATTPLLIKNAYYFDIDGDGVEEAVVNAGNQVWGGVEPTAANLPAAPECTDYAIACYFAGTGEVLDISNMQTPLPNRPLSEAEDIWYAYQPPSPGAAADPEGREQWYEQFIASYQYNADGDPVLSPIFCMGEYWPNPEIFVLLADIDGDGQPELLTCHSLIYCPIEVYKFTPGQPLPTRQFGINTPA